MIIFYKNKDFFDEFFPSLLTKSPKYAKIHLTFNTNVN